MALFSRNKIGLALGGGGARGIAHIGVIKVLEKYKIPIDYIAGTSAGALIGGMYAANKDIKKIEKLAREASYKDFIRAFSDPSLTSGLVKGNKFIEFIENKIGKIKIEETKIPFHAVAADIINGQPVIISKGSLAESIRASSSVPGIFQPFKKGKRFLVDGGLVHPVPVQIARKMGASKIIAVNLNWKHFPPKDKNKDDDKIPITSILYSAFDVMSYYLAKYNIKKADIIIEPKVPDIPMFKLFGEKQLIKIGEKAALEVIDDIKWIAKKRFFGFPVS